MEFSGLSLNDLEYEFMESEVGVSGLSINDLKRLYYLQELGASAESGLPDPTAVDDLADTPTASTATFSDPSATHDLYAPTVDEDVFNYRGATDFQFGQSFPDNLMIRPTSKFPNEYLDGQPTWAVEFITDAPEIKFYFKYLTASNAMRVTINGKRVTDLPTGTEGVTLGSRHLRTIDFGSSAVRRIMIEMFAIPFGGIWIPKTYSLWRPQPYKTRVIVMGDSIPSGSNENTGASLGTWVPRLAAMMGWDDIWNQSIGGVGYVDDAGVEGSDIASRIYDDVIDYEPDKIIFFAGYNDDVATEADRLKALDDTFSAITTSLPVAKVLVVGCWSPRNPAAPGHINVDNNIKQKALEYGFLFTSPITGETYKGGKLLMKEPAWITGTGNTSTPAGNGNADRYIGGDGVHPNDAGHKAIADRLYRVILATGF